MVRSAAFLALLAVGAYASSEPDALSAREAAFKVMSEQGLEAARSVLREMLMKKPPISSAYQLAYLAELMKLTGDPRASEKYREAIDKNPEDPAIELLFGEYLRNFRGPMQPMLGGAEHHFFESARKVACASQGAAVERLTDLRNQLTMSIARLYERDGTALYSWTIDRRDCQARVPGFSLFLSSSVNGGERMTDLEVDSDIRDLTSAAAYSRSLRLTLGPLSSDLLRSFLRTVTPIENRNRLRARYKGANLDLFFNNDHADEAAITNPNLRNPVPLTNSDLVLYNALKLEEFGVSVGKSFQLSSAIDADVEATYSRIYRTGLIDYLPNATEDINQVVAKAAVSRFVGPDKVNGEFTFLDQSIRPEGTQYSSRDRQIYSGTFRYQMYRLGSGYGRLFQSTRGLDMYAGTMHDHENYGYALPAPVNRNDYFVGATIHGIKRRFDFSVQPTWYTYGVPQDSSRNSRQYRTAAYGLIRLVDEERFGPNLSPEWHGLHLGFIHLTIPIQSDVPLRGVSAFANQKVGAELSAKWFTTARGGTTFMGSARYDVQQFTTLNRTFSLFTLGLTMGL